MHCIKECQNRLPQRSPQIGSTDTVPQRKNGTCVYNATSMTCTALLLQWPLSMSAGMNQVVEETGYPTSS